MGHRFKIADWVTKHNFDYTRWEEMPVEEFEAIRDGLSRFRVSRPVISIVIPVTDQDVHFLCTLSSFAAMDLPFTTELIVVNNTTANNIASLLNALGVRYISELRSGVAKARLTGLKASRGKYHLCGDGSSLYPPHWIWTMAGPLMTDESITCVYGGYCFLPHEKTARIKLALYELIVELLFWLRKPPRRFLNIRGANFAFRTGQGIAVKGFVTPSINSNSKRERYYLQLGEDRIMARKLGLIGEIKYAGSENGRVWANFEALQRNQLSEPVTRKIGLETTRILEYMLGTKKTKNRVGLNPEMY